MPKFCHKTFDGSVSVQCDVLQGSSPLVLQVRRDSDGIPIQLDITIAESLSFRFGQIHPRRQNLQTIDQKLVPLQLLQLPLRSEALCLPLVRTWEFLTNVPVLGVMQSDEITLPQLLTSNNPIINFIYPLSITRVWPPAMTDADDASKHCSTVAWLYLPDLGTFLAESPPFPGALGNFVFASEKSLLDEVSR